MSERFVNVDRDTPMLLPPSLQDWLPEGHLVHFVVETVTLLPLHGFRVNTRGTGNDKEQLAPAVANVVEVRTVTQVLADTGYFSVAAVADGEDAVPPLRTIVGSGRQPT